MLTVTLALLMAVAAPAPAAAPTAQVQLDPARLALAKTTVDQVWPLGTYQRMMSGSFDQMMDGMMASMLDMKAGDMVGPLLPQGEAGDQARGELGGMSMREIMAKADPHFEERMRITNRTMMAEMIPVLSKLEPAIRDGLARAYAGKFTAAQLGDLNAFFATPTGRVYATESLVLFTDPEVMKMMASATPELMKAMPAIMQKVQAATAHLPAPLKQSEESDKAAETNPTT